MLSKNDERGRKRLKRTKLRQLCGGENMKNSEKDGNVKCVLAIGIPINAGELCRESQMLRAPAGMNLEREDRVLTKKGKFDIVAVITAWVNKQDLSVLKTCLDEIEHVKTKNLNYISSEEPNKNVC